MHAYNTNKFCSLIRVCAAYRVRDVYNLAIFPMTFASFFLWMDVNERTTKKHSKSVVDPLDSEGSAV